MKWTHENIPRLAGKVIIVTGGNSGIGFETVKALSSKGASLIMASRSVERAEKAKNKILSEYPDASIKVMQLDLADLDSIKKFASEINDQYAQLDVLLNNAGIMSVPYRLTKDGFEDQLGTNHLGHFALTALLLNTIVKTRDSRIVNVSSMAHKNGEIDFDDLQYKEGKSYSKMGAYSRSKLANLLFTFGLRDYLYRNNFETIAVAAHPGITESNISRHLLGTYLLRILKPFIKIVLQKAEIGALPQIRAAIDPNVKGGDYYGPGGRREWSGYPVLVEPAESAKDKNNIVKLWKISEEMTGVRFP